MFDLEILTRRISVNLSIFDSSIIYYIIIYVCVSIEHVWEKNLVIKSQILQKNRSELNNRFFLFSIILRAIQLLHVAREPITWSWDRQAHINRKKRSWYLDSQLLPPVAVLISKMFKKSCKKIENTILKIE